MLIRLENEIVFWVGVGIEEQLISEILTPSRKHVTLFNIFFSGEEVGRGEDKDSITRTDMHVSWLSSYLSVVSVSSCFMTSFCLTVLLVLVITRKMLKRPRLILVTEYKDGD